MLERFCRGLGIFTISTAQNRKPVIFGPQTGRLKKYLLHFVLATVAVVVVGWAGITWLNSYTRHGEAIEVPALNGLTQTEAAEVARNRDLLIEVVDSIYSSDMPRGVIVNQSPREGSSVKSGRKIFVTVNSQLPQQVNVPDLVGKSRRIALSLLDILGIRVGKLTYKPDNNCTDCVLEVLYEGKPLEANARIRKGEKIDLVLGEESAVRQAIPDLTGLTRDEARTLLSDKTLNLGFVVLCEGCESVEDTAAARIYRQVPPPVEGSFVSAGSNIDIYLTLDGGRFDPTDSPTDSLDFPR